MAGKVSKGLLSWVPVGLASRGAVFRVMFRQGMSGLGGVRRGRNGEAWQGEARRGRQGRKDDVNYEI